MLHSDLLCKPEDRRFADPREQLDDGRCGLRARRSTRDRYPNGDLACEPISRLYVEERAVGYERSPEHVDPRIESKGQRTLKHEEARRIIAGGSELQLRGDIRTERVA